MYDSKTLADIQMRIAKGWVIRRDEMAMLLRMAQELVSIKEGKPASLQPGIIPGIMTIYYDRFQP